MDTGEILIYETPDGNVKIDVRLEDETVWLTQKAMAVLFDVQVPAINKHLKNIFEDGELDETVVISKMETTTKHGAIAQKTQTKETNFYNLDAIISVGYRVNSAKATAFRIWATKTLKEDIFAECSIDYTKNSQTTQDFYAMVQNKFHYAITGQTAAEIIYAKADRTCKWIDILVGGQRSKENKKSDIPNHPISSPASRFILYHDVHSRIALHVHFYGDDVWLTQPQIPCCFILPAKM